jgi:hypothetical protein
LALEPIRSKSRQRFREGGFFYGFFGFAARHGGDGCVAEAAIFLLGQAGRGLRAIVDFSGRTH